MCNIKIDENNYLKDGTVRKSWYNKNGGKNNNNTIIQSQQSKSEINQDNDKKKRNCVDSVKNRTLIIGFSNCGKTYVMNHILHQKQEPIFIITKSLNQYPNINAQTSDEFEPLENYENSTVVFDDMLQQSKKVLLICSLPEDGIVKLIYITYLKFIFSSQNIPFVIILK